MASRAALVALLASLMALGTTALHENGTCTKDDAATNAQYCLDCMQSGVCNDELELPEPNVDLICASEVCAVLAGVATCVKIDKQTDCSCDDPAQCDFYNPNSVLYCGGSGPILVQPCEDGTSCDAGVCDPLTTTIATTPASTLSPEDLCANVDPTPGYAPIPPDCTSAIFCKDPSTPVGDPYDCAAGEYFDVETNHCLAAPPSSCEGSCTQGSCPDKVDCTQYHICEDGVSVDVQNCTVHPFYDPGTEKCDKDVDTGLACAALKECVFDSDPATTPHGGSTTPSGKTTPSAITTPGGNTSPSGITTPSAITTPGVNTSPSGITTQSGSSPTGGTLTTTPSGPELVCDKAHVDVTYEYDEDCSKYYRCVNAGGGNYQLFLYTCYGDLVYNPATGYCDLSENVPDCVPPAETFL